MPRITATTSQTDRDRVSRLLLAWIDGDKLALDTVLDEAMSEPAGVPGLLFGLTAVTADLIEKVVPDARDQLRVSLLPDVEP